MHDIQPLDLTRYMYTYVNKKSNFANIQSTSDQIQFFSFLIKS